QPAVNDNFLTSGLQEDHLSLGESAALKLNQSLENAAMVLAIEYLLAGQSMDLFDDRDFAPPTTLAWSALRGRVPSYTERHAPSHDMQSTRDLLREHTSLATFRRHAPHLNPGNEHHV